MKYNFDERIDRTGRGQAKWEPRGLKEMFGDENLLSFWVADMDFRVAPPIRDALIEAAEHGCIGYTGLDPEFYEAYINWQKRRNGWEPDALWFRYTPGVVPAINLLLLAMTNEGDEILIQRPVYYPFTDSIVKQKRTVVSSSLVNKNGKYEIDFEDFEKKASSPKCTAFILCNPHNPVGRVYTEEELRKMGEICNRHGVFVIADEIHSDLIAKGHKHVVYAKLGKEFEQNCAVCHAPSKTFNLAGLQQATAFCRDRALLDRLEKTLRDAGVVSGNIFGMTATEAAFAHGDAWLDAMLDYVAEGYAIFREEMEARLPGAVLTPLEATYLGWLDLRAWGLTTAQLMERTRAAGVEFTPGTFFGADAGEGAHVLALFLVHGQRGQHRPVGDVVHAVGDVPEYVREAEHDDEPVVCEPEVREQYEEERAACHRADEHGRLVLAPGAVDVVDDEAGDWVVERVEDAQHGEHHARRREHADGQGEDVGEVVQQGVGLKGVEHIPAHGAEAEEVFIALFQLCHALSSPLRRISRLCRG